MSGRSCSTFLTAAMLLVARAAAAQSAAPPPPPPVVQATAEATFVGVTGNASSDTFGLSGEAIVRPNAWLFRQRIAFIRNESAGLLTAKSFSYTPRAERALNPRLSLFGEYTFFRDRFSGVINRHAITGGLSIKALTAASQTLQLDLGGGYLNEQRAVPPNVSSGQYTIASAYRAKLSTTADVSDDVALQGNSQRRTDWRFTHTIAVSARLTDVLSLKVSSTVRYVHEPPTGFKRTDTQTSVALVATLPAKH